jgi:hypothetical protein
MLSQNLNRRDHRTPRISSGGFARRAACFFKDFGSLFLRLGLPAILLFFISCQSKPTDLRALAPAETLVYLESRDLSKTLDALTESRTFAEAARSKPDFSRLGGVQLAVAVTGFEASEKQLSTENSVLSFKSHFVAIIETHAWNWQALSLTENQIGNFVKTNYGDEVTLEKSDKAGGKWFAWTAKDESKVFAYVENGRIFFGNDAAAVEKCLLVKNGEADSLLKNEALSRASAAGSENDLAFGYVAPEGVAQLSNLAGVSVAADAAEEAEGKTFIARVLPQILRSTTRDIVWSAQKNGNRIEDKLSISLAPETISLARETLATNAEKQLSAAEFLPDKVFSATRYNLKNPLLAWRSLILTAAKNSGGPGASSAVSGNLIVRFSGSLLESYGISDAETFLSNVDSDIFTAQFDAEGEKSVVVAIVKDRENLKKSLSQINFKAEPERTANAEIWRSEDKLTAAAFAENKLIVGEAESVLQCLEAKRSGQNFTKNANFRKFAESNAVAVTFAGDLDAAEKIVEILSGAKDENKKFITNYLTETRVTEKGIERRSLSDFGLIGTIVEQLEE